MPNKNAKVHTIYNKSAGHINEGNKLILNNTADPGSDGKENALPKRFIAGAICPQCQRIDKIFVYTSNGVKKAECISCGFLQRDPASAHS